MPNKVIHVEQKNIDSALQKLSALIPCLQNIYDAVLELGIEFNTSEIWTGLQTFHRTHVTVRKDEFDKWLVETVKDKLLQKTSGFSQFDSPIFSKEKLRELIELPDLTKIKGSFSEAGNYFQPTADRMKYPYIEMSGGKIQKSQHAKEMIMERFTHYTTTEKGDIMLEKINNIIKPLEDWLLNDWTAGKYSNWQKTVDAIRGIDISYDTGTARIIPDVQFIKTHEKL